MLTTEHEEHNQGINEPLVSVPPATVEERWWSGDDGGGSRWWEEEKKLWRVAGPSLFSRVASFSMGVVTTAFAGHLGDLPLASFAIANTVLVGFNFGLLLGMASALETLCGQAFGAKRLDMLGIYLQRSWIILFLCSFIFLPIYIFATPILKLLGQPTDVADLTGTLALWLIPLHFTFGFVFPVQRFLQSQLKVDIIAWVSLVAFVVHVCLSWALVNVFHFGIVGLCIALCVSWWIIFLGQLGYVLLGGCPDTWTGFSWLAFSGLWEFVKLSTASGVMLCLENWYYRILVLLVGGLSNAEIAIDALSICMTVNGWEMMIPIAMLAAVGVRVANELGAGNWKAARFATVVATTTSVIIGLFFSVLIMVFHNQFPLLFSTSDRVLKEVDKLSWLLAVTILLNSIQPVLSGVAIGSGWQAWVAYINIGCYYFVGLPLGVAMGWLFHTGVMGIWAGMILGGTALQTLVLGTITIGCDWQKEAMKANLRVKRWSVPGKDEQR